jgi:hypothetical protein
MDLTGTNGEIHAFENGLILYTRLKIANFEKDGSVGMNHFEQNRKKRKELCRGSDRRVIQERVKSADSAN